MASGSPLRQAGISEIMRVPASKKLQEVQCCCRIQVHTHTQHVGTSTPTPNVTPPTTQRGALVTVVVLGGGRVLVAKNADDGRTVGRVELSSEMLSLTGVADVVWVGCVDGSMARYRVDLDGGGETGSHSHARSGLLLVDEHSSSHSAGVHLMAASKESLISASQDGCVVEWSLDFDTPIPQEVIPSMGSETVITALTSSASSVIVATQGLIKSINTVTGQIMTFSPHEDSLVTCLMILFASVLWSCSTDGVVCITSLKDASLLHSFSLQSPVISIALVGCKVWLWSADGTLRLADPITFDLHEHHTRPAARTQQLASCPVGLIQVAEADIRRVWTPYEDGSIGVWDVSGDTVSSLFASVCEGLVQAEPHNAPAQGSPQQREREAELEGQILIEQRRVGELEETVKGLVGHCSEMQEKTGEVDTLKEELRVSFERVEMVENDCSHLSKELESAMVDLHGKDRQIHILSHSLADLEGLEEETVTQHMAVEDMQRDLLFATESGQRADITAAHETQHSHHLSLFWSHLCRMHHEEIRSVKCVNNALKMHIDTGKRDLRR